MHRSHRLQSSTYRAAGKPERLLRASVTAFCSITRPTRREIAQLDDLAVPLLGCVSDDCLRFVAAALSDLPHAPPTLVRRLADQSVDISAPILMRSPALSSIDLVALIGRHGIPHARAIVARRDLDERIARLIRSIGILEETAPDKAEETRSRLRAMMRPAGEPDAGHTPVQLRWQGDPGVYRKLRSTVLAGMPDLFHTALASALGIGLDGARAIAQDGDVSGLAAALRSLSLTEEQAFLIVHSLRPERFSTAGATARFLDAFQAMTAEGAAAKLEERGLVSPPARAANEASGTPRLRAS